jgi:hypothetical protein
MEPYALQLPKPTKNSCTFNSINLYNEYFLIYDLTGFKYSYEVIADEYGRRNRTSSFEVDIHLPGLDYRMSCDAYFSDRTPGQPQESEDTWFDCISALNPNTTTTTRQPDDMRFGKARYDPGTNSIGLNISWACADKSPNHP